MYHNQWLEKMVRVAREGRLKNMSSGEIVGEAIHAKVVLTEFAERSEWCDNRQVKEKHMKTIFDKTISMMTIDEVHDDSISPLEEEDFLTGFKMFAAIAHCPSNAVFKLYKFFRILVSTEDLKTILKATVNTIAASKIRNRRTRGKVLKFYDILEETLKLEYGTILIASSSSTKQKIIIEGDFPFTAKHKDKILSCFNGTNCSDMRSLLKDLGNTYIF